MFAVDGLGDDLFSLLLDQLSISHYLILRHVNRRFRNAIDRRYMMPNRIDFVSCFGSTIDEKEEDQRPSAAQYQKIVVRAARLTFSIHDDAYQIVVDSQTQSLFIERDYSGKFFSRYPVDFNGFMANLTRLSRSIRDLHVRFRPNLGALELCYGEKMPRIDVLDAAFEMGSFFHSLWAVEKILMEVETDEIFRAKPLIGRCRQCQMQYGSEIPWRCGECIEFWSEAWVRNWRQRGPRPFERKILAKMEMTSNFRKYPSIHNDAFAPFFDLAICPSRPQQSGYLHKMSIAETSDDGQIFDIPLFLKKYERRLRTLHNGMMTFLDDTDADAELLAKWMPDEDECEQHFVSKLQKFSIEVYGKFFLCAIFKSTFFDQEIYLSIFDK
ncbi:unnamed protein product, partial [Mesorhabditis spiculigera]